MRVSINRELRATTMTRSVSEGLAEGISRVFDDHLEEIGVSGVRFEKWCQKITGQIYSDSHDNYLDGLAELGILLGYTVRKPKYRAATDCLWRGVFGNSFEVLTIEAKIEHEPSNQINAKDVGQVHNQVERATSEFGELGYDIRGIIITHLKEIAPEARSALGQKRIVTKEAILALWEVIKLLLTDYRSLWNAEDISLRKDAFERIKGQLPPAGWLIRAINNEQLIITTDILLKEWPHSSA
jgi:hypothetical protein